MAYVAPLMPDCVTLQYLFRKSVALVLFPCFALVADTLNAAELYTPPESVAVMGENSGVPTASPIGNVNVASPPSRLVSTPVEVVAMKLDADAPVVVLCSPSVSGKEPREKIPLDKVIVPLTSTPDCRDRSRPVIPPV
jgi:hypothetical protein